MMNLGEKLNEEELKHMMSIVDKDGDGEISYEEFSNMMTKVIGKYKWDLNYLEPNEISLHLSLFKLLHVLSELVNQRAPWSVVFKVCPGAASLIHQLKEKVPVVLVDSELRVLCLYCFQEGSPLSQEFAPRSDQIIPYRNSRVNWKYLFALIYKSHCKHKSEDVHLLEVLWFLKFLPQLWHYWFPFGDFITVYRAASF